MKKVFILLLIISCIVSLAGCSKSEDNKINKDSWKPATREPNM